MSIYSNNDDSHALQSIQHFGLSKNSVSPKWNLTKTIKLITEGQYQLALDQVKEHSSGLEMSNIKAVLLMRLGRHCEAVNLLRPIVFDSTNLTVKRNIPDNVILNFATSLLLTGHVSGCLEVLNSIQNESNESVRRVRDSIHNWEKSLGLLTWFDWKVCGIEHISGDFPLDHLPGVFDWEIETQNSLSSVQSTETALTSSHDLAV